MNEIKVIDSRMGRGKTSAAIAHMNTYAKEKRFMYITPYLTEVTRICNMCGFAQPDGDKKAKSIELKGLLHKGKNISSTHSLFYLMDEEALQLVRDGGYTLIVDEAVDAISSVKISDYDFHVMFDKGAFASVSKDNFVHWNTPDYKGAFDNYKCLADAGMLYRMDSALLQIMNPKLLTSFEDVIMMTYLFDGQYQKAYLDYFGLPYKICGIDDTNGFRFTDEPDNPPMLNYNELLNVIVDDKINDIGDKRTALSMSWYARYGMNSPEIKKLRNNMNTFFARRCKCPSDRRLWTCFKSYANKLEGDRGRYRGSYLQPAARATNEFRDRDVVAYMINRFVDPNISKFFAQHNVKVNEDDFALGEMLQFIWRSAIRDDNPITLYVPSRRMRTLLLDWIDKNSKGGAGNR